MTSWTRRSFLTATLASTAACSLGSAPSTAEIDRDVAASRALLFQTVPGSQLLARQAAGVLIIPRIIEGGFVISGAYGEGALMIGDATVDYMSMAAAAVGLQIGAQTYAQALFFLTPQVLADFRVTDGWELGVDAEYAIPNSAAAIGASTSTIGRPVFSIIYGQRGLIVGTSLEGAKYNRIIR